jgi:hypothetical protein
MTGTRCFSADFTISTWRAFSSGALNLSKSHDGLTPAWRDPPMAEYVIEQAVNDWELLYPTPTGHPESACCGERRCCLYLKPFLVASFHGHECGGEQSD